jgi:lysozyme
VGFGHVVLPGESFSDALTRQQGLDLLRADVNRVVFPGLSQVNVALNQNQVDALSSFIFNVGPTAFGDSTLLRELNAGNFAAVPGELRRFVFSQGQQLPGLVRRRETEGQLFSK